MSKLHIQSDNNNNLTFKFDEFRSSASQIDSCDEFSHSLICKLSLYANDAELGVLNHFAVMDFIQEMNYALSQTLGEHKPSIAVVEEYELEFHLELIGKEILLRLVFGKSVILSSKFTVVRMLSFLIKLTSIASLQLASMCRPEQVEKGFLYFWENENDLG